MPFQYYIVFIEKHRCIVYFKPMLFNGQPYFLFQYMWHADSTLILFKISSALRYHSLKDIIILCAMKKDKDGRQLNYDTIPKTIGCTTQEYWQKTCEYQKQ